MRGLLRILFIVTLLELFLGGGGRVFEIGAITLRILLFGLNIVIVIMLYGERGRIPKMVIVLSFIVLFSLLFYSFYGFLNGAPISLILEDVKPLSYFFSIVFFTYYIDSIRRVQLVVSLLKYSSLIMALIYLSIQLLLYLGKIEFVIFYDFVNTKVSSSDFYFRGKEGLFFYKGFLYMIVGLIFWIHTDFSKIKAAAIFFITLAMILSGTRGFIIMFGFIYALFYGVPLLLRLNFKIILLAITLAFSSIYFFKNIDLGNKNISDSVRVKQIIQVFERIDPLSLFIGHGFGNGVPIREVHMEIGYLEVFHKQGLLGLIVWVGFFLVLYKYYTLYDNYIDIRKSFFLSVMFVLLLSSTNPFFNNPIGISLFLITLSVFRVFNSEEKEKNIQFFIS